MSGVFRRLRARLRYGRSSQDLAREIEAHRAMHEEQFRADGASPDQARWQASRVLGNVTLARETARGVWITPWLESIVQDIRYGVRSLARSPGFTLTALAALVIGLGLNASLFSAMNGLLLRTWDVPRGNEMVAVFQERHNARQEVLLNGLSVAEFSFLRRNASTADLIAMRSSRAWLGTPGRDEAVHVRLVSDNYFQTMGAPLALGRGFRPDEDDTHRPVNVAVIAHEVWQRDFGGSTAIIGQTISVQNVAFTIVGVAPSGMADSPMEPSPVLWLPLASLPAIQPDNPAAALAFLTDSGNCCVRIAGRLRSGRSAGEAQTELSALDRQFVTADDAAVIGMRVMSTALINQPQVSRQLVPLFLTFFVGVGLVLLLACANVGNLQLARAMARRREMAIRLSLGAARGRLVRQLLVEGLLLSTAAAALSLLIARVLPRAILRQVDDGDFSKFNFSPDGRVFVFVATLCVVTTLLSGLAPALRTTKTLVAGRFDLNDRRTRLRSILLAAQIAVSIVLLLSGALLVRGLGAAGAVDPGFALDETRVITIVYPREMSTGDEGLARRRRFAAATLSAANQAELVIGASVLVPLGNGHISTGVSLPGEDDSAMRSVHTHHVSRGYFDVLKMPMRAGRSFQPGDTPDAVVVNESLAQLLWPDGMALGRELLTDRLRPVVGIVADARTESLDRVEPTIFEQAETFDFVLTPDSPATVEQFKALAQQAEPQVTFRDEPLNDNLKDHLRASRVGAGLAVAMGVLALLLAAVGTFGVFSYVVGERTKEIGVRVALGGRTYQVLTTLLRRMAWPVTGGTLAGVLASFAIGPVIGQSLYGVSPFDPIAYGTVIALLACSAITASLLPARRALSIDPAITLRHE